MIYIQQNGSLGKSIPYPSSAHKNATIATSGCGVCSSLMVLSNSTSYTKTLKAWTTELRKAGCRAAEGTNMNKVSRYLKDKYGFKCETTDDISKLIKHLEKGYKAIANVGGKGYFSSSGHFVCVAGITKSKKAIVLDPYIYNGKFTATCKGINRKNYFTYNSSTHEVTCSFVTILNDSKGAKYYLFTPTKKVKLQYSNNDIKKNSKGSSKVTKAETVANNSFPVALAWKNGSTKETTYMNSNRKDKVGYIGPNGKAKCYGKIGGNYIVSYNLDETKNHKVGFVAYAGGISKAAFVGETWINGSTKETVYADTAKKTTIGYINARSSCKCLGKVDGMYLVAYKITNTKHYKVGFVTYNGGIK